MASPEPARLMAPWMVLQSAQVASVAAGLLPSTERVCVAATMGAAEFGARTATGRARRRIAVRARRWPIRMADLLTVARLATRHGPHRSVPVRKSRGRSIAALHVV